MKPFKSTELRDEVEAAFVNGDDAACAKTLTDPDIADRAWHAVFHDWPDYFSKQPSRRTGSVQ